MAVVILIAGIVVLTAGAEILVRSASSLAAAVRISPLVIGLTIVAYGTGSPELVVSLQASYLGEPEIALGNVIGSNILNVLLILGLSAMIVPLIVSQQLVKFDVPLMVGVSIAILLMSLDGQLGRVDGIILVAGLVMYTAWAIIQSRREQAAIAEEYAQEFGHIPETMSLSYVVRQVVLLLIGFFLLIWGSSIFSSAAVDIARFLGISELVIGLTIVAVGTSLPEVATSVMAALRGERDIAVGNVVGSNLFNLMGVLGTTSIVAADGIPIPSSALQTDLPIMVAVAVACLPVFFTGNSIARWEGFLFFFYYCVYTSHLILSVKYPVIHRTFHSILFMFVIPLTVVTVFVIHWRALRAKRTKQNEAGDPVV